MLLVALRVYYALMAEAPNAGIFPTSKTGDLNENLMAGSVAEDSLPSDVCPLIDPGNPGQ
jgi:hypothetical protein